MLTHARTKIVCTLGPASSDPATIRALVDAGMNVARINFSHGTHAQHDAVIATVRAIAQEAGKPVAILADLQGPRIRIGDLPAPLDVAPESEHVFVPEAHARGDDIPVTYDDIARDVKVGGRILVNDGLLEFRVVALDGERVRVRTVYGGRLTSHKGMNLPGTDVTAPSLTDKDRDDIAFAAAHDVAYVALSFVRRPEDIAGLRALLPRGILIVAKIEKDSAVDRIEDILRVADAVMVARGDLGVELPFERVPLEQKRIIALAQRFGRPVITATQMLESMVDNPRPTRAEANDVANAVLDGTDAVMLSAETASGHYPELAVRAMHRIAVAAETAPVPRGVGLDRLEPGKATIEETIASAAVTAVRVIGARCVIVFTKSGFSARIVAGRRPAVPIVVLTDQERTWRQLALVWGVAPFLVPHCDTYEQMAARAREVVVREAIAVPGDRVVITAGVPFDVPGSTNTLKVETI
ncbi:MAG TPA: pyruvate kinase [Gemmatimonadaceae bacterium]|nr:pyruvate kinase [Gemmatimonadaceae bacterium]